VPRVALALPLEEGLQGALPLRPFRLLGMLLLRPFRLLGTLLLRPLPLQRCGAPRGHFTRASESPCNEEDPLCYPLQAPRDVEGISQSALTDGWD
jgi:hypothetical protein